MSPVWRAPLLHIAGRWRAGTHARVHTVVNPADGQPLGELSLASAADLDEALAASARGFAAWRQVPAFQRAEAIRAAAQRLADRAEAIAPLLTLEQGKTLAEAKAEIASTVQILHWYAEEGRRSYGRVIPPRVTGSQLQVVQEPVGPCAAFSPWNFPMMLASRKVAGALATGCSVILKAAEETPAAVAAMVQCFLDSGLPEGALQLVYGVPAEVSQRLLGSPVIRKLSFTGSVPVGKELARLAAQHLQHVTLELGGIAPVLVFDDANLQTAVQQLVGSKFRNAGQICASPTRFLVQRKVYGEFIERFAEALPKIRVGSGMEPSSTMGPLANARRQAAMQPLVDDALQRGARLAHGGRQPDGPGAFYPPTLLADVSPGARAMQVEPFGPLVLVRPFDTEAEAVALANDTPMGLAAYLFTESASRERRVAAALNVGMVAVNVASVSTPEAPFGGVGDSGYGQECGIEGLQAYLNPKFIHSHPAWPAA